MIATRMMSEFDVLEGLKCLAKNFLQVSVRNRNLFTTVSDLKKRGYTPVGSFYHVLIYLILLLRFVDYIRFCCVPLVLSFLTL